MAWGNLSGAPSTLFGDDEIPAGAVTLLFFIAAPAQSAEITVYQRSAGEIGVLIDDRIYSSDEKTFADKTKSLNSANTFVKLRSPGGDLATALLIGETVHTRGFSTIVDQGGACGSACPIIWFGGRRSLIQRNSLLVFHMPYDPQTGKASPEAIAAVIDYLRLVGLSDRQARFLATAALPEDGWVATEASALALGFHPQVVFTPLATRTCQSRFCLGIP